MAFEVKIYKDNEAGLVFFEGTTVLPQPVNVVTAVAHPTLSNRIVISRTDQQKADGSNRVLFKKFNFVRARRQDGTQVSNTDRQTVIDYLNAQFASVPSVDVNSAYQGTWNAYTGTPDLTGSTTPVNGDWYYVDASGSHDFGSGSISFLRNDIVKFVSRSNNTSEWERIVNETVRVDTLDAEMDNIIQGGALSQFNIYVDADYTGSTELGTSLRPYKLIQTAVDNAPPASSGSTEVLLNGTFDITSAISITGNKKIHFRGTEGATVQYASYNQANSNIFTYTGTDYNGQLYLKNLKLKNAGGFAVSATNARKVEINDCIFNYNGWSGNGLSLTAEESGSTLGYNSNTASLASFYSSQCSEGGALYTDGVVQLEFTDNSVYWNNKGLEIVDSGYVGTTNGYGYVSRNQIYSNVSIGIDLEASTGDATSGNKNFTLYNNNVSNNGDTGVKIQGGLNNTLSLSTIKGNWNSAIELDAVGNTRVRDLDLDNNNRAGVDAEGDAADGLATLHITGSTLDANATFIADIFNTQILNTQLGSNSVKCGVIVGAAVGNISGQNAILKFDNLTFMNQDYALDFEADLDNLEVIVGECEYVNTSIQSIRLQGTGKYLELPFKNFTVDVPYLDFSIDRVAKTISLKDGQNGKVINVYPINSIKGIVEGSRIDIIQTDSDKIQIRGLTEGRVYKEGDLISGSLNDVNNAINAAFTETTPTPLTPTTTLTTVSQSISTFGTGSNTGTSGSYFTGSDAGFNHGFVLTTDNALTSSGEFYTFTINTEGIIGMGFNKSGSAGAYASESIGTGTGTAENGYYWSTWFHPTPDGPWAYYGESAGNTALLSGWYNFDDSDSGADWLNGDDVTMRAGIDNDGYPYLSYYSANAGGYVPIARDGNTVAEGSVYNLLIKFGDENAKVSNVMLHHTRDLTAQDLTYYAIESPDGVWYYPMFLTTAEANWFDSNLAQPIGAGTNESYTFVDDTTGTTYYIPASGSSTGSAVHPTGSYLSGSTFNYVVTENDDLYAPSGFGNVTTTLNEGATLNQQVIAPGQTDTVTLVNPPSWISLAGYNAVGTAPDVLLHSGIAPSASYDVTVRTSNAYGFTDGTLTVKVLNTTTNVSLDGTIHQGTFLSHTDYNNDYGTSLVTSVNRDAVVVTTGSGENGAVYDLPYPLDDGDSYEWPFTAYLNFGIVSESVDKTGSDIVNITNFNTRFDLLFSNKVNGSTLQFSRPQPRPDGNYNELEAVGWDNNTYRDLPGGPHATTFNAGNPKDMFKLYNNAGRIELSYDINDGSGYQLFASSSELYGTGSDAPTITAVAPASFTEDYVTLPSFTYTANGASAPNGFTLVSGAMDTSLITVSQSVASLDSIEIDPGQRLIVTKEWAETNVLPYISELGDSSHKVLLGVSASNPSWDSIGQADFDSAIMWANEGSNYTRYRLYVAGNGAGTNNVNSDTDGYYDHAIEFTREGNLFIGRTAASNNNVETLLYSSNTWANSGSINAWTASRGNENPITPIMGSDNSRMRLSTTGLSVQRAPLPTRQYDVVEDNFSLPLFKRYNETDVVFGGLTLNAGETYKFWLHDSSIESTDLLSFVSASDSSAITQGITSSGTPGTFGSYLEFNVPSDIQPIKVGWTSGGTLNTGSVSIVGSTYVEGITGITLEGPTANQTGTNVMDQYDHGWISLNEQLSAGERLVLDNAFFADFLAEVKDTNNIFAIGLKGDNWANTKEVSSFTAASTGEFFKGNTYIIGQFNSSGTSVNMTIIANGVQGNTMLMNTTSLFGTACAFLEISNSGNNIRAAFGRNNSTGNITAGDESTVTYANWNAYKGQTGDQGYGISNIDVVMSFWTFDGGAIDGANIDWTGLSEVNVPTAPTITTSWTKALDFSGGNEYVLPVNSSATYSPLEMGGSSVTVSAPASATNTTAASSGRPWATAIVFRADGNASNQHIWNSGEGASSTHDNIYLRLDSSRNLYFGWGRSGAVNECKIATAISANTWYGVYVATNGTRLSGANATAANLADAFDIRLTSNSTSWAPGSDLSTSSNWTAGSTGGRMDRAFTGDLTIGGRGGNRNFHGKIASTVVTTLRLNVAMPGTAEIEKMITDPEQWLTDYKVGNLYRQSSTGTNNSNFQVTNSATNNAASYATQVWIMGDGTNDSYSNGIRNQVNAGDQNFTKLNFNSMVSSDIETVTISGLT